MNKNNILYSLLTLTLLFAVIRVKSQESNIISNLTITPQSLEHNPALFLEGKAGYVGFPLLSSINVSASIPWNMKQMLSPSADGSINLSSTNIYNMMKENNVIATNVNIDIIRFGFKAWSKGYVHVSVSERISALVNIKKNTLGFFLLGNGSDEYLGKEVNMSNSGISQNAYTEIALGYSQKIGKSLTVGGKFKYLIGQTNVNTNKSNLTFYTDPTTYAVTAKTDILINTSLPFANNDFYFSDLFANNGIAFDLGATYSLFDNKLKLQASIVDLGYIKWKANTETYRSIDGGGEFVFDGFNISVEDMLDESGANGLINTLLDSIEQLGVETVVGNKYTTRLDTKFYAGASYTVVKGLDVSGLFRMEFDNKFNNYSLGVALTYKPAKWFNLSVGNTFSSISALGLGAGFAINGGAFQFYLMADQISGFTFETIKSANVRFGINFVIKEKDKIAQASKRAKKESEENM